MTIFSPEQLAFREFVQANPRTSIILNAVAGSGKTYTLINNLDVIGATGAGVATAFNKKMSTELETRVAKQPTMVRMNWEIGTAHSLANRAIKKAGHKPRIWSSKGFGRLEELMNDRHVSGDYNHPLRRGASLIVKLSGFAKNAGFDLHACDGMESFASSNHAGAWLDLIDHYNLEADLADKGLEVSEAVVWAMRLFDDSIACGQRVIDFDDMIYLPLRWNLNLPTYANVLVDEAQDTNATRRELAIRSLRKSPDGERTGRLIAVGDPHQAIYGFTGADAFALRNIQRRVNAHEMPLSVCFRCDEKIIEVAQQWVPHIKSHDNEGKGEVSHIDFMEVFDAITEGDAVLCRLNRPNVSLCMALLRRGRRARIEGRDLGERLLSHAKKADSNKGPLDRLQHLLEGYVNHQVQLLTDAKKASQAAMLEDEVDCLHMLIDRCLELGQKRYDDLAAMVAELFIDGGDKRSIVLSSIHKAKGLEFPRVFWLGKSDYQPFFLAQMEWELEQEDNLCYVAATRAEHSLIIVGGVEAALKEGKHRQADTPRHALPQYKTDMDERYEDPIPDLDIEEMLK